MSRPALTPRQQEVLDFIRQHIADRGYPPSMREIATAMNVRSTNTVQGFLDSLTSKGYLEKGEGFKSRTLRIVGEGGEQEKGALAGYSVEQLEQEIARRKGGRKG